MIKATGIITLLDGVSQLKNPDINIYVAMPQKKVPAYGVAQAGKYTPATETTEESFLQIQNIGGEDGSWNVKTPNPTFDEIQTVVLEKLIEKYPTVVFKIV